MAWTGCRDGTEATYIIIAGGDHPRPGGRVLLPSLQGEPSRELDAGEAVAAFFDRVARRLP